MGENNAVIVNAIIKDSCETQHLRDSIEVGHLSSIIKDIVTNKLLMSLKLVESA